MYKELLDSYPRKTGESWWIVDVNNKFLEFKAPVNAFALCVNNVEEFQKGTLYKIVANEEDHGYISLSVFNNVYKMPYYLFARHFDAEAFVKNMSYQLPKRKVGEVEFVG
jgi:hypothetical protein